METSAPAVPEKLATVEHKPSSGLVFERVFTKEGEHPFESVNWVRKDAVILGADGREKFRQDNIEVPDFWPDNTINIVAEKYFRVVDGVKENSAKQMFSRVAGFIRDQGFQKQKIFRGPRDADIFEAELLYALVHGMYAFNSPVWFNAGAIKDPQCSACFIQSVDDSMDSIMNLAKREVMLFKGGSGTGGNLSNLRSSFEQLSRGGWASGPVSFMKGFDSFAGVTKSGGTTRRAAKMQVLNIDHPDILEQKNGQPGFITCKSEAEKLAHDLYETGKYSAEWNKPGNVYDLVGYQNANNSVRVTDEFMQQVELNGAWETKYVSSGEVHKTYDAQVLWHEIAQAAWFCGDPGVQFDTTTNRWHTCKASGRINASNPCSEYLFLDETACNLGSINLLMFAGGMTFDVKAFKHVVDLAITAKEIIVDAASYPTEEIAERSHKFRTLGLGFTNLGALLTYWGLPYDSDPGRKVAGLITSIMGGEAYAQSARIAKEVGTFPEYEPNRESMLEVIRMHLFKTRELNFMTQGDSHLAHWRPLGKEANSCWQAAVSLGEKYGYRNAQTTVIAPTGTISFLMRADTTALEPMLGVVTYKKVVGEGVLTIPNRVVPAALRNLGYSEDSIQKILKHIESTGVIHTSPEFKKEHSPIFAEALGEYALGPEAHVDMMAAIQPFISGGISKTVNMPANSTPKNVADIYMRAWKKGLKCIAIYRDGCKLSQPIATKLDHKDQRQKDLKWGQRRPLPDTRAGKHHKFKVGGVTGYLQPGEFPDGRVGETFIRISKQGSFLNGMVESFATSVSLGLQYGVPLHVFVEKFKDVRFEPSGFTGNQDIPISKSLVDYIFRWLEQEYLKEKGEATGVENTANPPQVADTNASYDGPPCSDCGSLTKRAGACYVCSVCGATTGCG